MISQGGVLSVLVTKGVEQIRTHSSHVPIFGNTSYTQPNSMFKALDISLNVNLLFSEIISLIIDTFSFVIEVDKQPERC
jgi:hypothetical protein